MTDDDQRQEEEEHHRRGTGGVALAEHERQVEYEDEGNEGEEEPQNDAATRSSTVGSLLARMASIELAIDKA